MADYNSAYTGAEIDEAVGNGLAAPTTYAPISHANANTTYGTGTGSNYGHLKLSDSTSSTSGTSGGTAATPAAVKAVMDAIPTVPTVPTAYTSNPAMNGTASAGSATNWARGDHIHPTDSTRAPTSHATTATTYGIGTGSNYGHVKLSDSATSTSAASSGIAASPKAVKTVNDRLTYGTTDLTAGTSSLTTGVLYFVYE